ncbi:serine carboxypeptidase family protein (macronuclear) [Tetrahymena thermophila SB210]|uniref:Serine carboxypeptidase family protein n=1 Tax=Tetrahymena thermophila (strain SB210) TaxID=312017 RepID=Q22AY8_TETTS|nr:serine carboxypeptidase family protein [Tetrahymena thermophila SB210]EAR82470.2 serine carboxypeptidase family protein [Tetrahymena thermophila SB210]|eukprot:XP_001030133.2 serine carboxypeptidase family protein [Tetrahymena thermophila SB210]
MYIHQILNLLINNIKIRKGINQFIRKQYIKDLIQQLLKMKQTILILLALSCVLGTQNPLFLNETYTTGLITIKKSSDIFYWHFESRSNPSEDPIAFWLAGGPGASSMISVLAGNGPYRLNQQDQTLETNIYAWNNQANMVFVDQPVGTGFSNAGNGELTKSESEVEEDFYQFLLGFFEQNPQYIGRPLYLTGVSYAGHFVPAIGASLIKKKDPKINLQGLAIGNGWVDPQIQYPSYGEFAFKNNLISSYEYNLVAKPTLSNCSKLIAKKAPYKIFKPICMRGMYDIVGNEENPKFDVYNVKCTGPDCESAFNGLSDYFNRADVQAALGVSGRNWQIESDPVYDALEYDYDLSYAQDVAFVLESGIKVLVYYGDLDFICNYIGGLQWAENMNWSMQKDFQNAEFQDYLVDGKVGGQFKSAGKFSFLTVNQSGHMVTVDQPALALQMFNQFISNQNIRNKDQY